MKTIPAILFISICLNSGLTAQAQTKEEQAAQQKWMAYAQPGPMHKMLSRSNGKWTEEVTMWSAPGAPPQSDKAICMNTMIMGDRYQESTHQGIMMGMPFEGRSIVGYDNSKKMFESTWIDNMGSGIMYLEGKWDEKSKTIHFTGTTIDPMTDKIMNVKQDFKIIDDDTQLIEMYMVQNGKDFKTMQIKLSRNK